MDSIRLCNEIRRARGPAAICAIVLSATIAAAQLPDQTTPASNGLTVQDIFLPPKLAAATVAPNAPAVYRLPPVEQPGLSEADTPVPQPVEGLSEVDTPVAQPARGLPEAADKGAGSEGEIGVPDASHNLDASHSVDASHNLDASQNSDDRPVDDQSADQSPPHDVAPPVLPEPVQQPSDALPAVAPSLDDPVPEDLDTDAGASAADVDAPSAEVDALAATPSAQCEDSSAPQDVDQPDAPDNHPGDVAACGGPVVEPAVEAGVLPYTPTAVELTVQLLPAVQHACSLADHGATFAARTEFIQVLRRIAQALDAQGDTDEHARALAAGLRALDEADDFAPRGTQLEAELDVALTASSHRTPVLAGGTAGVTPREAAALYLSYAQGQLGQAVAGQQAGSMALHALGRLYSRLAQGDDVRCVRKAMTMYLAALEACPQNHMAANELGVMLARNGHYGEAETMFRRAVTISPSATGYHNLAVVQQKLGRPEEAIANQQQADRLAAWERANGEVSRRMGIQWVPPDVLAHAGQDAWTSAEAVARTGGRQQTGGRASGTTAQETGGPASRTVGRPPTAAQPTFPPPPLEIEACVQAPPVRIARPLPAQTRRQVW